MTKNKLNCWDMEQQSVCVCCSDVPLVLIYPMHCCLWWPQCRSSSSDGIEFPCGKWRLRRIVCRPVQWNFIYTIEKNTHSIHLLLCIWLRRFRACNCIRPFRFIRFCQSNYRRSTKKKKIIRQQSTTTERWCLWNKQNRNTQRPHAHCNRT